MAAELQILITARNKAMAEFARINYEIKRIGGNSAGASSTGTRAFDRMQHSVANVDRTIGRLAGSYFSLGAAIFGTISLFNKATDAYEKWATAAGGEEAKKISERTDEITIAMENLGRKSEHVADVWNHIKLAGIKLATWMTEGPTTYELAHGIKHVETPDITTTAEQLENQKKIQQESQKKWEDLLNQAKEKERKRQEKAAQEQLDIEMQNLWYDYEAQKEAEARKEKLAQDYADKIREIDEQIINTQIELEETKTRIAEEESERRKQIVEEEAQNEIRARYLVAGAWAGMAGSVSQALILMGGEQRKYMNEVKAFAIIEAIINTAVAASKANSATPYPPVNALLMAEAIAQGAVQIAAIASQQFATGGVTPGGPAMLHPNEVILNPRQQANLLFQMSNGNSGGSRISNFKPVVNINISGNADANTVRLLEERIPQAIANAARSGALKNAMADMERYRA